MTPLAGDERGLGAWSDENSEAQAVGSVQVLIGHTDLFGP